MINTQDFLSNLRQVYSSVELAYMQPSLFIFCIDDDFSHLPDEKRMEKVASDTKLSVRDIELLCSLSTIEFKPVSNEERRGEYFYVPSSLSLSHWLPMLDENRSARLPINMDAQQVRAIHFYGYKGGQARSSVLCVLAASLAEDGYNVLIVDSDMEAPSMPAMIGLTVNSFNSTLMGICGWAEDVEPIRIEKFSNFQGIVDLIACRPDDERLDMDFSAFALRASMDTSILIEGIHKLKGYVRNLNQRYDVVLFDHRTGFSLSVLPIMEAWPGSVVVNVRLDGLSDRRHSLYRSLFSINPETPGAFVSFSLDPEDTGEKIEKKNIETIDSLLNDISINIGYNDYEDKVIPGSVLKTYWVNWFHDRAFLQSTLPRLDRISKDNISSMYSLRYILELPSISNRIASAFGRTNLTLSGSRAEDLFIETRSIQNILRKDSPYKYIFGRKGTGKTRIFRRFVDLDLAEPLLATNDFNGGGISSNSLLFDSILDSVDGDYKLFWWAVLYIVLDCGNSKNSIDVESSVARWKELNIKDRKLLSKSTSIAEKAGNIGKKKCFVIDGVETAVSAKEVRSFIESLFMFLLSIQSDKGLSNFIDFRLFLRSDLQVASIQNIEQQVANRKIELLWDKDAIFNFLLAKIVENKWFTDNFSQQVDEIKTRLPEIQKGSLEENDYKYFLDYFFPNKIRRNNLLTYTFFQTYFSDTSGDKDGGAAFYPRLFERFLIELEILCNTNRRDAIVDGKVNHLNMLDAHSKASLSFMDEITQELHNVLSLDSDVGKNRNLVAQLMSLFEGKTTPFNRDIMANSLCSSLNVDLSLIIAALESMKKIGVFEDRTGYPGEWRAGGLYKYGLKMKYVR